MKIIRYLDRKGELGFGRLDDDGKVFVISQKEKGAFEATEDQEILQAGYRFFRWLLDSGEAKAFMLQEILAIMPLLQRTGLLESFRRPDIPCTADSLAPQEQQ